MKTLLVTAVVLGGLVLGAGAWKIVYGALDLPTRILYGFFVVLFVTGCVLAVVEVRKDTIR